MKCDLCQAEAPEGFRRPVHINVEKKHFGEFCSRFCAIHALLAAISADVADGQAPRQWENGQLLPKKGAKGAPC